MESMSGEEAHEPHGGHRDGQNDMGQKQTSSSKQNHTIEALSRSFGDQGDYFQRPKQSETSNSTSRAAQPSGSSADRTKQRPAMSNRPSTSQSYTLDRMHEDPKTSDKISRVVAQLDDDGVENLEQLVAEFARQRAKPKGQLTSIEYRDQNPWYDQGRSKPNFSLGEPLPHVGEDNNERTPGRDQVCASLNPSSQPQPFRVHPHITPIPPTSSHALPIFLTFHHCAG